MNQKEVQKNAIQDGKRLVISIPYGSIIGKSDAYFNENFGSTSNNIAKNTTPNQEQAQESEEAEEIEEEQPPKELASQQEVPQNNEPNIIFEEGEEASNTSQKDEDATSKEILNKELVGFNIIIYNLGLNVDITKRATELPADVGLSFSPYAGDLQYFFNLAHEKGKKIYIDLPLESTNYPIEDPGSLGLLTSSSERENLLNLDIILNLANGYYGLLALPNENYTFAVSGVIPMIDIIKQYNKIFVFQSRAGNGFLIDEANAIGLDFVSNYKTINKNFINKQNILDMLEDHQQAILASKANNSAQEEKPARLVILPAYPVVITALEEWLARSNEKGKKVLLTPIEELIE